MKPSDRSQFGLPAGGAWRSQELGYNVPSRSLIVVFENSEGEWNERKVFVRGQDERTYRPVRLQAPDLDLHEVQISPDRPVAYVNVWRRADRPMRGHFWDGLYAIGLPEGKLSRLTAPAGYGDPSHERWISRLMGVAPGGLLHVTVAVTRVATQEECVERTGCTEPRKLQIVDYFLAEYDTDAGTIKELGKLLSPFF